MTAWFNKLAKQREWEEILSDMKYHDAMPPFDNEFSCSECGETITYDIYMESDAGYCCPFCSEYFLPYH